MASNATDICNLALTRIGEKKVTDITTDTTPRAEACNLVYNDVRDEVFRAAPWNCLTKRTTLSSVTATITGITAANPPVVSAAGHTFTDGEHVLITDVVGMTEVNGNRYRVDSVVANVSFELQDPDTQTDVDGTGFTAYTSGGVATETPYPIFDHELIYDIPSDCERVLQVNKDQLRHNWSVEGRKILTDFGSPINVRYIRNDVSVSDYDPLLVSALAWRIAMELAEDLTQSNTKDEKIERRYLRTLAKAMSTDGKEGSPSDLEEDAWITARDGGR